MKAILTYAENLSRQQMAPFIRSAAEVGHVPQVFGPDDVGGHHVLAMPVGLPHNRRFACWLNWLEEHPEVEEVLLCDGRDVVFQSDPFDKISSLQDDAAGFACWNEHPAMTIGNCPYNSKWARRLQGDDWLASVGHRYIPCVGVVWCRREWALDFLRTMTQATEVERWLGADTAAFQYCIFRASVTHPTEYIINPSATAVWHVGYVPRETVQVIHGCAVTPDGVVPAVVHQWDRHRNLVEWVTERWGG